MAKDRSLQESALIRELAELLNETNLSEIEIEKSGLKVRVCRNVQITAMSAPPPASAPTPAPPVAGTSENVAAHAGAVKSPMVGTAYLAPEPGAAPFVEPGTKVTGGQTIMIIEAMKTMNAIPAPRSGTVSQVFVENGQPVEFGEPLMIIE